MWSQETEMITSITLIRHWALALALQCTSLSVMISLEIKNVNNTSILRAVVAWAESMPVFFFLGASSKVVRKTRFFPEKPNRTGFFTGYFLKKGMSSRELPFFLFLPE